MTKESVDEIVNRIMEVDKGATFKTLESAFGEAPIHIREEVTDVVARMYNHAIEENYFSAVNDPEDQKYAQREYAFRTAVEYGYMKMGWDVNGED